MGREDGTLILNEDRADRLLMARADLQMDRSNFIRYCIAKELKRMGVKVEK
jgi:hypothetical protein